MTKAFFINYRDCFNCHSCEVACQMYHGFEPKQGGIKVNPVGPWEFGDDEWVYDYVPFITEQCDKCQMRISEGKEPTCVQHCEGSCLKYGDLEEMLRDAQGNPKCIIQLFE